MKPLSIVSMQRFGLKHSLTRSLPLGGYLRLGLMPILDGDGYQVFPAKQLHLGCTFPYSPFSVQQLYNSNVPSDCGTTVLMDSGGSPLATIIRCVCHREALQRQFLHV